MGLPVRQRNALDCIERALHGSDPRLAALFAIFGKLTREEEMPRIEQLRHGARIWLASLCLMAATLGSRLRFWHRQPARHSQPQRSRPRQPHRLQFWHRQTARHSQPQRSGRRQPQRLRPRPGFRLGPRQRFIFVYPIAIALAVTSLVLAAKLSPSRACLPVRAVAAAKNVAKSNLCRPPAKLSPLSYGH